MSDAAREVTLEEWINKLPVKHRARMEYSNLKSSNRSLETNLMTQVGLNSYLEEELLSIRKIVLESKDQIEIKTQKMKLIKLTSALTDLVNKVESSLLLDEKLSEDWDALKEASDKAYSVLLEENLTCGDNL